MTLVSERPTPPSAAPPRKAAAWRRFQPRTWVTLGVFFVLLLFATIVYPQLRIVSSAFTADDGFSLQNFLVFFTTDRFLEASRNSIVIALVGGLLACVVAVPGAYFLAHYDLPGRAGFLTAATLATVSPPFLGAYAWVLLAGRGGILTSWARSVGLPLPFETIIGPQGIIWVTIWGTQALVFLIAHDAFRAQDPALEEAALSVGSRPMRTRLRILLPLALPAIVTGLYMSSMKIFADFGTPLLIGGGLPMLPTTVYFEFLSEVATNPAIASAASLVMPAIARGVLGVQQWVLKRRSYSSVSSRQRGFRPVSRLPKALMIGYLWLIFVISFVPHGVVLLTSFLTWRVGILKWVPTLDNYVKMFANEWQTVFLSIGLALIGCFLCVLVALLVSYIVVRKRYRFLAPALNGMVMIPYIIPGTVLAIGLIMTFSSGPIVLTGTAAIIVLVYFVRRLPYVSKTIESALVQVHPALEEAASSVGAKPMRTFWQITFPAIRPAVVSGGTVAFLQMVTELSATIMVYAVPWVTMTVVIFTNTMQPGSPFGVASAMAVLLMLSVYVPLYLVRRRFSANFTV